MSNQEAQKVLRIGILRGGNIVEERLLTKRAPVTLGDTPHCTFYVPRFPAEKRAVFGYEDGKYAILLGPDMDVRLGVDDQTLGLPELQAKARPLKGGGSGYPLEERARGKLTFGDITVLFQFVPPPPPPPKLDKLKAPHRTLAQFLAAEASILIAVTISLAVQGGAAGISAYYAEPVVKKTLADRYKENLAVDVNFKEKKPEEKKPEEEKKAEEEKAEEKAVAAQVPQPVYQPPPKPVTPRPSAQPRIAQAQRPAGTPNKPAGRPSGPLKPDSAEYQHRKQAVRESTILKAIGADSGPGPGGSPIGGGGDARIATAFDRPAGMDPVATTDNGTGGAGGSPFGEGGGGGAAPKVQTISDADRKAAGMTESLKTEKVEAKVAKAPEAKAVAKLNLGAPSRGGGIGKLDSSAVAGVFKRRATAFRTCYESRLRDKPNLAGKVVLRFTIGSAGRVTNADVASNTTSDSQVADCIVSKVRGMRFDPPANGDVTFTYPIVLSKGN